jgi:hypothetical protein
MVDVSSNESELQHSVLKTVSRWVELAPSDFRHAPMLSILCHLFIRCGGDCAFATVT